MGPNGHRARLICITTPQPLRVKAPVRSPGTTTFGVPGRGTIVRRFRPLNHVPVVGSHGGPLYTPLIPEENSPGHGRSGKIDEHVEDHANRLKAGASLVIAADFETQGHVGNEEHRQPGAQDEIDCDQIPEGPSRAAPEHLRNGTNQVASYRHQAPPKYHVWMPAPPPAPGVVADVAHEWLGDGLPEHRDRHRNPGPEGIHAECLGVVYQGEGQNTVHHQ